MQIRCRQILGRPSRHEGRLASFPCRLAFETICWFCPFALVQSGKATAPARSASTGFESVQLCANDSGLVVWFCAGARFAGEPIFGRWPRAGRATWDGRPRGRSLLQLDSSLDLARDLPGESFGRSTRQVCVVAGAEGLAILWLFKTQFHLDHRTGEQKSGSVGGACFCTSHCILTR